MSLPSAVAEGVRNVELTLADRAIVGPHDYTQILELVERSRRRVEAEKFISVADE